MVSRLVTVLYLVFQRLISEFNDTLRSGLASLHFTAS